MKETKLSIKRDSEFPILGWNFTVQLESIVVNSFLWAMNYTALNETILRTARSIIDTLPKDEVKQIGYSTFCQYQSFQPGHRE